MGAHHREVCEDGPGACPLRDLFGVGAPSVIRWRRCLREAQRCWRREAGGREVCQRCRIWQRRPDDQDLAAMIARAGPRSPHFFRTLERALMDLVRSEVSVLSRCRDICRSDTPSDIPTGDR